MFEFRQNEPPFRIAQPLLQQRHQTTKALASRLIILHQGIIIVVACQYSAAPAPADNTYIYIKGASVVMQQSEERGILAFPCDSSNNNTREQRRAPRSCCIRAVCGGWCNGMEQSTMTAGAAPHPHRFTSSGGGAKQRPDSLKIELLTIPEDGSVTPRFGQNGGDSEVHVGFKDVSYTIKEGFLRRSKFFELVETMRVM